MAKDEIANVRGHILSSFYIMENMQIEYNCVYKALFVKGVHVQWLGKRKRLYSVYIDIGNNNINLLPQQYIRYNGKYVATILD